MHVEDLAGREVPGDAVAAHRGAEALAAFVARDHSGAHVSVLAAALYPRPGDPEPLGDEDAERADAVVIAGDEDPVAVEPLAEAAVIDAVRGGNDDAHVWRFHRGARAARQPFAMGQVDEDRAVLPEAGRGRIGHFGE